MTAQSIPYSVVSFEPSKCTSSSKYGLREVWKCKVHSPVSGVRGLRTGFCFQRGAGSDGGEN